MARAIGYPESVQAEAAEAVFRVDGMAIRALDDGGRIRLCLELTRDEESLPKLAEYCAGRILKEEAALAWGDGAAFLWQDAPAASDGAALRRLFETFTASCDWWKERASGLREPAADSGKEPREAVIRP